MLTTFETNGFGEQVVVTTINNGTIIKELNTPPPAPFVNTKLSKVDFIKRFTPVEYAAIKTAAAANATIDYYWQLLMVAEFVDKADATTIAGINALEGATLLAAGRAAQILA